jgi:uncharacterized damage-inducible protein DinB
MTDASTIQFLWKYMAFADDRMAEAATTVDDPGFVWDQGISFGSIAKLLNHAMIAEKVWLTRLRGTPMVYADEPLPPRDQIAKAWSAIHAELLAFADGLTPAILQRPVRSQNRAGLKFEMPTWAVMLHVADHATYHRGQLNTMIKKAGGKPSPVMVYTYGMENGVGQALK